MCIYIYIYTYINIYMYLHIHTGVLHEPAGARVEHDRRGGARHPRERGEDLHESDRLVVNR